MQESARAVIVGGGIIGTSVAYHLVQLGWKDVLLLEKGELTCGSTWHAAGLVGQLRSKRNITRMLKYSVELYKSLENETGLATGWKECGGLRLACTQDRLIELKKAATTAKSFGLEMHLLSPKEALDLFPIMSLDKVIAAAIVPSDGSAEPTGITQSLAKGARNRGAKIICGTTVTGVQIKNGAVYAVETDKGTVKCEYMVNCAGIWARNFAAMAGVNIPLIPVQHQFLISEKVDGLPKDLPTLRDPDNLIYYKEEVGGLVMGGYEPNPIPWKSQGVPSDFESRLLEEDYDQFSVLSEAAMMRTPCLQTVGIRVLINGPEAFTPDGNPILGEAPEVFNYFVAAGFNAHGIAAGGGAGRMVAEWIVAGEPSMNLWPMDIRRFGGHHKNLNYVTARTCELYSKHYTMSWPHEEYESARGLRKGPIYQLLKEQGAVFGEKFGWERPNWFAPKGVEPKDIFSFGNPNWFEYVGQEHRAIREKVALIDQSSFSKFEVSGSGALAYLQYMATNNIDKPVGSLIYTQLCNSKGKIEADLTIARVEEDVFYIVTGTAFGNHDMAWLNRHAPRDGTVHIKDITASKAVINICGPDSRNVLRKVCQNDLESENFKFATCQQIDIGLARVLALRITFVGELGWELHLPVDHAQYVYQQLWQAGQEYGIVNAGYRSIESCRLEKGYLNWSTDISPDNNPYEARLGFCVALKRKGDFHGRKALEKIKADGISQIISCFTLDPSVVLTGGETICRQDEIIGVLTSGGFGHTVNKAIAYGYIPKDQYEHKNFEIEVLGIRYPAQRHDGPLYDPKRERVLK